MMSAENFRVLCERRAQQWADGEIAKQHGGDGWIGHAVDWLQLAAVANGLLRTLGQDEVQRIMAEAFAPHRGPDEPKPHLGPKS